MMEGKQFLDANMRTRFTDKYVVYNVRKNINIKF